VIHSFVSDNTTVESKPMSRLRYDGKKQISPTRQEDEPDSKQVLHEALSTFDVVLLQYWKLFDCL